MGPLFITASSVISAIGGGAEATLAALLGRRGGLRPCDFGAMAAGYIGRVEAVEEHALPDHLAAFDCRNNRLLASALDEIAPSIAQLREDVGARRIAVVLGTSTSGIATGEEAAAALAADGRMPASYHYRQQEIGMPAEFAARYLKLDGLRYTISTACSMNASLTCTCWTSSIARTSCSLLPVV